MTWTLESILLSTVTLDMSFKLKEPEVLSVKWRMTLALRASQNWVRSKCNVGTMWAFNEIRNLKPPVRARWSAEPKKDQHFFLVRLPPPRSDELLHKKGAQVRKRGGKTCGKEKQGAEATRRGAQERGFWAPRTGATSWALLWKAPAGARPRPKPRLSLLIYKLRAWALPPATVARAKWGGSQGTASAWRRNLLKWADIHQSTFVNPKVI